MLAFAELLAMGLWFSASAVLPQLVGEWQLTGSQQSWMTISVQLGFVAGALISAVLNLPDRVPVRYLFAASAVVGAVATAAIPLLSSGPTSAILLRFLTGVSLAGVYPPGMKLMATWCKEDRGFGIGLLVGALTLGSALPHLLNAVSILSENGLPPWRTVLVVTSILAVIAALLAMTTIQAGPHLTQSAPFNWKYIGIAFSDRPIRLANYGYLGHMWELYAAWAWVPFFLIESYQQSNWSLQAGRLAGFSFVGVGALGSILAGIWADRLGRTFIASWSLAVSGCCTLVAGFFSHSPAFLTAVCLIWGFAIVADSAQFSAAVSELSDSRYVGTALTIQTSLGFLLSIVTIYVIPAMVELIGWQWVFVVLMPGPALGILNMLRLRRLPSAIKMASGSR